MSSFATIQTEVEALYIGYFMRAGDPGGTQYWINQIQNGTLNLAQAAASFSVQLETLGDYPFLATGNLGAPVTELGVSTYTNVYNFINQVYEDLFNRTVDAGGLAYWSAQLVANIGKPQAFGDFIINVISGAATGGADDLTLQAKVAVAAFITNSTESDGLTWSTALQTESENLIAATTNASGSAATEEAAWTNYISSNFPSTFTLTTGVDAPGTGAFVTPISGNNNLVYGTFNGPGSTYTTGDDIVAPVGSTGNTLTLTDLGTGGVGNLNSVNATVSNMSILNVNSAEGIIANTATGSAGFSGLTTLNVTDATYGAAALATTITAAASTLVVETATATLAGAATTGTITVTGGSVDTISDTVTNTALNTTVSEGAITVTGLAGTTSVSVTQSATVAASATVAGITAGSVTIADANAGSLTKAATISSVTLDNYGNSTISSNALATLTLSGTGGTLGLTEGLTTPTNTTLAVDVNGLTGGLVTDNSAQFTTLDFTTGTSASTLTFSDSAATALSVAGSSVVDLSGSSLGNVTTIAVSGAGGLTDSDYAISAKLTTVSDSSSGPVTLSLNDTVASFSGGTATGTEIITITADATKAITGDGVSTSEIVFNAAATTFTSANTGANVTGFDVLGVGAASTGGIFNMGASPFQGYTAIDDQGANGAVSFTDVTSGTPLAIDAPNSGNVTYQLATAGTSSTAVGVTLGLSATEAAILGLPETAGGFSVVGTNASAASAELTLWDSGFVGLPNVNFIVNNSTAGQQDNINYLNDLNLSALTVTGTGDLEIGNGTVNSAYVDTVASLSIADNSTSTAGLEFYTGITDNTLTSLTLAGSNIAPMTLNTLTDNTPTSLTIHDTYAGAITITTFTPAALTSLTVTDSGGNFTIAPTGYTFGDAALVTESFTNTGTGLISVSFGNAADTAVHSLTLVGSVNDYHGPGTGQDTYTGGITVAGGGASPDNAVVVFETTATGGATTDKIDNITLGNGNDTVLDDGVGTVNITLGTGSDTVIVGEAAAGSGTNTVIFGAHASTVADAITIGATGTSLTAFTTITGLNASGADTIQFFGDAAATGAVINENANIGAYLLATHQTATLATDIAGVLLAAGGDLAQHAIGEFTFTPLGGQPINYLIEQANATGTALAAGDTLVGLVGTALLTSASTASGAGVLHLLG